MSANIPFSYIRKGFFSPKNQHWAGITRITFLWLGWAILVLLFQAFCQMRFELSRPDQALGWTAQYTKGDSDDLSNNWPSKKDLFLTSHTAWDSRFYLSIALNGYDDVGIIRAGAPGDEESYSLNYSFFPLFPCLIRAIASPAIALGLQQQYALIIAGVMVSLFGTLAAMISIYYLVADHLDVNLANNAPFFLVIFPSAIFLPQVYTEGLFLGLSFACLLMISRKHFKIAGFLFLLALLTRPNGVLLFIPFLLIAFEEVRHQNLHGLFRKVSLFFKKAWPGLIPMAFYGVWYFSEWGYAFRTVGKYYFGRSFLDLPGSIRAISDAFHQLLSGGPQSTAYFMIEFGLLAMGIIACLVCLKRTPVLAIYSLAVVALPLASGQFQSISRYILAMPVIYLFLCRLGKHPTFERIWTLFSLIGFSILMVLFTFDFWVA